MPSITKTVQLKTVLTNLAGDPLTLTVPKAPKQEEKNEGGSKEKKGEKGKKSKEEKPSVEKKNLTVGLALSNIVLSDPGDGFTKIKKYIIAKQCYEKEKLEIDLADFNVLKHCVQQSNVYGVLIVGQILTLFEI